MKNIAIAYAAKRAAKNKNNNDSFLENNMDTPFESEPYENESETDSGPMDNVISNSNEMSSRQATIAEIMRRKLKR